MAAAHRKDHPHDALALLVAEHDEVRRLTRDFERARKADAVADKRAASLALCGTFERLAAVKHEVFHPAAAAVLQGEDRALLDRAAVIRQGLHDLVARIRATPAVDPSYDALVLVLAEHAGNALRQEEERLFGRLRHSGLDLQGTGERMAARLAELRTATRDDPAR